MPRSELTSSFVATFDFFCIWFRIFRCLCGHDFPESSETKQLASEQTLEWEIFVFFFFQTAISDESFSAPK